MSALDAKYVAFTRLAELLFDVANTVDGITGNPFERYRRGYRACDHSRCKLWFGRKAGIGGHVCGFQTIWIVGPVLRKIQRTIDERMTMTRNVGSEDVDLAVRDLPCRTGCWSTALKRSRQRCRASSRLQGDGREAKLES